MKHARGKRILAAFLSVAMTVSMLSTQVFAAEMPENTSPAVTLGDGDKSTRNMPTRTVTDADVADMQGKVRCCGHRSASTPTLSALFP